MVLSYHCLRRCMFSPQVNWLKKNIVSAGACIPGGMSFMRTRAPSLSRGMLRLQPRSATCHRKEM